MTIHLIHQRTDPAVIAAVLAERERRRTEDSERERRRTEDSARAADPGLDLVSQQEIWDAEGAHLTVRRYRLPPIAPAPLDPPAMSLRGLAWGLPLALALCALLALIAAALP